MKLKHVIFVLAVIMLSGYNKVTAQLNIIVDSVGISRVVSIRPSTYIMEGFYDGPTIYLYFSLINSSSTDTICLFPSKTKIELLFNYHDQIYRYSVFPIFGKNEDKTEYDSLCFYHDTVVLEPNQKKEYYFSSQYLQSATKGKKCDTVCDYSSEVLETLPTLRVRCFDGKYEVVSVDKYFINDRKASQKLPHFITHAIFAPFQYIRYRAY